MFPLLKTMQKKKKDKEFYLLEKADFKIHVRLFLFLFFSHQINKRIDRTICYAQQPAPQARKKID